MITFLSGDATEPKGDEQKIICHICNNSGGWGRGFVLALSKKWNKPEREYRNWYSKRNKHSLYSSNQYFQLGNIQTIPVEESISVCNMIAQHGYGEYDNGSFVPPIRYKALEECLSKLQTEMDSFPPGYISVHMPDLIGCGLAGGKRETVLEIIEKTITAPVFIYKFQKS